MAKAIGLDIGSRRLKIVEVEGAAKKYRITKFLSVDVPEGEPGDGELTAHAVADLVRQAKAQRDNFVAAMDARSVVIREIMVPFLQDDQIRRVLRFEAEAHLHNYAIEDVVVDYVKIGEIGDQSKILIFAAPKDRIGDRLAVLRAANVEPMHLSLDITALYNAARVAGAFEENPNCVILDIGATSTNILFVKDGELKSCRSLRTGSESITRVLSQDLAVDTDAARERVERGDRSRSDDLLAPIPLEEEEEEEEDETERSASDLEFAIVLDRQSEFLARIYRETTRSLAAYAGEEGFSALYLTGGASLAGGTREKLEERFGKPVVRLDFLGDESHDIPAADHDRANAEIGVALGLAMRLLDDPGTTVEFRREEFRYTRKFDLIKVPLASTVSLVFILLFLTWLRYQNLVRTRSDELTMVLKDLNKRYISGLAAEYEDVLGEDAVKLPADSKDRNVAVEAWNSQVNKMHSHITGTLGFDVKDVPQIRSALSVWRDICEKLDSRRAELGYLLIDEFKITQKTLTFKGLIGNRGNVDILEEELRKLDYVENVTRDRTMEDPATGKFKFGMTAKLTPTTSPSKGGK